MTLPLNPETIAACYDFLAETPPFNRWNLPPAEDVTFRISRSISTRGTYIWDGKRHIITISAVNTKRTQALVETLSHEMVHLHEEQNGFARSDVQHSKAFLKCASQVCKVHGFDEAVF